jgi:uncharacterized membrane protein YdjX (TVP38/TMEM64 family)
MEYRQARQELSRRSGGAGPAKRSEWHAEMHIRQPREATVAQQAQRQPADPIPVILATGVAAELILPWTVIWLSNVFMFDTPDWLRWLVFVAPLALGLLATLPYWVVRGWSRQPARAWTAARQGRW